MHLSRWHVTWLILAVSDKPIPSPTPDQLALLALGDMALLMPPPDKCDGLSLHWGTDPIYLPYDPADPMNAAVALAGLERARPCGAPALRRSTPLFCDGDGEPLRHGMMYWLLLALLLASGLPEEECMRYSWHSFRSWLACALLAAGAEPSRIQCMLRWRSAEALRIYARMNKADYCTWVAAAMLADVDSVRTTNSHEVVQQDGSTVINHMPLVDADGRAAALQSALPRMYVAAQSEDGGAEQELDGIDHEELDSVEL